MTTYSTPVANSMYFLVCLTISKFLLFSIIFFFLDFLLFFFSNKSILRLAPWVLHIAPLHHRCPFLILCLLSPRLFNFNGLKNHISLNGPLYLCSDSFVNPRCSGVRALIKLLMQDKSSRPRATNNTQSLSYGWTNSTYKVAWNSFPWGLQGTPSGQDKTACLWRKVSFKRLMSCQVQWWN